jgi:hypothetical protein
MSVGGNWERKVKAGAPSYHEQFNNLKGCKDYDILATPYAKPSREEQVRSSNSLQIWCGNVLAGQCFRLVTYKQA